MLFKILVSQKWDCLWTFCLLYYPVMSLWEYRRYGNKETKLNIRLAVTGIC